MPDGEDGKGDATGDKIFCERCGERLARKQIEHRLLPCCPGCGHVAFLDPKVAAVMLATLDEKLLLVRRAIEPALGRWSFPAGYVDRGEVLEEAAAREVREETGLQVRVGVLVGVYSKQGSPVVLAVYSGQVTGGTIEAGPEVHEVALFPPDRLPPLPFPHDEQILSDWRSLGFS